MLLFVTLIALTCLLGDIFCHVDCSDLFAVLLSSVKLITVPSLLEVIVCHNSFALHLFFCSSMKSNMVEM